MPMKDYSGKKLKALDLLATGQYNHSEIGREIGVSYQTIGRWLKDPVYSQAVLDKAFTLLKSALPDVYSVLKQKSKSGSHQHIKILIDHLQHTEELKAGMQTANITFTWQRKDV